VRTTTAGPAPSRAARGRGRRRCRTSFVLREVHVLDDDPRCRSLATRSSSSSGPRRRQRLEFVQVESTCGTRGPRLDRRHRTFHWRTNRTARSRRDSHARVVQSAPPRSSRTTNCDRTTGIAARGDLGGSCASAGDVPTVVAALSSVRLDESNWLCASRGVTRRSAGSREPASPTGGSPRTTV